MIIPNKAFIYCQALSHVVFTYLNPSNDELQSIRVCTKKCYSTRKTPPRQSELVRVESTDTIPQIGALTYKRSYIHLDLRRYNGVYCDSGDRLLAFREGREFNPLAKSDRSVPPIEHMKLV